MSQHAEGEPANRPIATDTVFTQAVGLMSNQVENEVVMMHFDRGQYFGLDEIGADIWNRLAQPMAVADLCAGLVADYEVDLETCQTDVFDLLAHMEAEGLVRRIEPTE